MEPEIIEKTVAVNSKYGLHIRLAKEIMSAASICNCDIYLARKDDPTNKINAKSILAIISLEALHQDEIIISAQGDDAQKAIDSIESIFSKEYDEYPG